MARYYFHFYDRYGFVPDDEGREFADLDIVREQALKGARSIISDDVMHGYVDLECRIDVTDDAGAFVLTIPFDEAVEFGRGVRPTNQ